MVHKRWFKDYNLLQTTITLPTAKRIARDKNPKLSRLLNTVERFATRMGDQIIDDLQQIFLGYEADPSTFPTASGLPKPHIRTAIKPLKTTRPMKRQFEPDEQCNLCFQYEAPTNDNAENDVWLECPKHKEWAHLVCINRAGEDQICANCNNAYFPKRRCSKSNQGPSSQNH